MFKIRFRGLLTHAKVDETQLVVIVRDPQHRALITVNDSDLTGETQSPATQVPVAGTGDGVTCYTLAGLMRLERAGTGDVQKNLNGVPSLAKICDGKTINPAIFTRTAGPDFHGFLELEGGSLGIEDWYETKVTFDGNTLHCLPRTILFSTSAAIPGQSVHFYIGSTYLALKPDAEVQISNLDFATTPVPDEYQSYKRFFTDANTIQVPVASGISCPYGSQEVIRTQCKFCGNLGVQCSNNQFP